MGAEINYTGIEGYPPVTVKGSRSLNDTVTIRSDVSSQFITALMLIAPVLDNGLTILFDGDVTSYAYIEMTAHLMQHFGAEIEEVDGGFKIIHTRYLNDDFEVEPDWSAASYFFEIAALAKEADIVLENLPIISSQGDSGIVDLYEAVFDLKCKPADIGVHIKKQKKQLDIDDAEFDFTDIPDLAQTVAATAAGLGMEFTLTGLQTLRIKETDRIAALKNELEKLGIGIEEGEDWIKISPLLAKTVDLHFNTYNDHRMAMALAPLALVVDSVRIENPEVVNKSFPGYWEELKKLGFVITLVD
jgi:3-phosphoshikimate 1-carboxyvinyltransferase